MAEARAFCPRCNKRLKTPGKSMLGRKITCPKCDQSFVVRPEHMKSSSARTEAVVAQPYAPPPASSSAASGASAPVAAAPAASTSPRISKPFLIPGAGEQSPVEPEAMPPTRTFYFSLASSLLLALVVGLPLWLQGEQPKQEKSGPETTAPGPLKPLPKGDPTKKDAAKKRDNRLSRLAQIVSLSAEEQEKVDKAIQKGKAFLQAASTQSGVGAGGGYQTGLIALRGLTLLECGLPTSDRLIQQSAKQVRESLPKLTRTYELSLAILFLDRLGEYQDRRRIQSMALRLVAGQLASGGWTYSCPILSEEIEEQYYLRLTETQPESPFSILEMDREQEDELRALIDRSNEGGLPGLRGSRLAPQERPKNLSKRLIPLHEKKIKPRSGALSGKLKSHSSLKPVPLEKDMVRSDHTDNSNTQFAILGLWTARRYHIPMDRSLVLLVKRFRKSIRKDGTWSYRYNTSGTAPSRPAMSCAGLLGLAVGHGLIVDSLDPTARQGIQVKDKAITSGMAALGRILDDTSSRSWRKTGLNLYLLWSVERVGVLYGQRRIGNTEWYKEGADRLVKEQHSNGSWGNRGHTYHGTSPFTDTCFALLFLKRSNLTQDLTDKLNRFLSVE